jgi:hypothetical protein
LTTQAPRTISRPLPVAPVHLPFLPAPPVRPRRRSHCTLSVAAEGRVRPWSTHSRARGLLRAVPMPMEPARGLEPRTCRLQPSLRLSRLVSAENGVLQGFSHSVVGSFRPVLGGSAQDGRTKGGQIPSTKVDLHCHLGGSPRCAQQWRRGRLCWRSDHGGPGRQQAPLFMLSEPRRRHQG